MQPGTARRPRQRRQQTKGNGAGKDVGWSSCGVRVRIPKSSHGAGTLTREPDARASLASRTPAAAHDGPRAPEDGRSFRRESSTRGDRPDGHAVPPAFRIPDVPPPTARHRVIALSRKLAKGAGSRAEHRRGRVAGEFMARSRDGTRNRSRTRLRNGGSDDWTLHRPNPGPRSFEWFRHRTSRSPVAGCGGPARGIPPRLDNGGRDSQPLAVTAGVRIAPVLDAAPSSLGAANPTLKPYPYRPGPQSLV